MLSPFNINGHDSNYSPNSHIPTGAFSACRCLVRRAGLYGLWLRCDPTGLPDIVSKICQKMGVILLKVGSDRFSTRHPGCSPMHLSKLQFQSRYLCLESARKQTVPGDAFMSGLPQLLPFP